MDSKKLVNNVKAAGKPLPAQELRLKISLLELYNTVCVEKTSLYIMMSKTTKKELYYPFDGKIVKNSF